MSDPVHAAALRSPGADPGETASRIRVVDVRTQRAPSGRLRVEVDLARADGVQVTGTHEDLGGPAADVRIAAEAAVASLHAAFSGGVRFEVAGAKTVRAFDQTVTLVLIGLVGEQGPARLLGAACNEADVARAAVLAVLSATNRVRVPAAA